MTKTLITATDIAPGVIGANGLVQDVRTIVFVFDGGPMPLKGGREVDVIMPVAGTIVDWTIVANESGSVQIDLWKCSYASYAALSDSDSITAADPPSISSALKNQSAELSGWSTSLSAGDIIRAHVDSSDTLKRVELAVHYHVPIKFSKYDASVAPTADDDAADGFEIGSTWIDTTHNKVYTCVDATTAAAVWIEGASTGIGTTMIDAIGDLIVGSAADTVARLPVGATPGDVLTVDPGEPLGMKWTEAAVGGSGTPATNAAALITASRLFR